jgi:exopolyphosphatase/guanosine-5'-triphosphate,3'-diphosphate pyrophosphatase
MSAVQLPDRDPAGASVERRDRRVGVIDIGSNSIRLVVYDRPTRTPDPVFNEKALCGLGKVLQSTGRLDPGGVDLALRTLARFRSLAQAMGVAEVDILATAAVRDAANGPEFVRQAEAVSGRTVRILSGSEEARFAALGVLSSMPDADGVVGDLGGGSLELVSVGQGRIGKGETLPVGPLRLADGSAGDYDRARRIVDDALGRLGNLADFRGRKLYAVGGTWRALARVHMARTDYPIHILHHYEIPRDDIRELTKLLSRQSGKSLEGMPGVSRKRLDVLPLGALVMNRLVKAAEISSVVVSAHGVREGWLFDKLPPADRNIDPMIAYFSQLGARVGRYGQVGEGLFDWSAPLFPAETTTENRLRHAACLMADVAWRSHPDYRAEHATTEVLRAPAIGIDHPSRAFLALTLHFRYEGDEPGLEHPLARLLSPPEIDRARILGFALRLGQTFAGGAPGILAETRLLVDVDTVALIVEPARAAFLGDAVRRRVDALAGSLGRRGLLAVATGR